MGKTKKCPRLRAKLHLSPFPRLDCSQEGLGSLETGWKVPVPATTPKSICQFPLRKGLKAPAGRSGRSFQTSLRCLVREYLCHTTRYSPDEGSNVTHSWSIGSENVTRPTSGGGSQVYLKTKSLSTFSGIRGQGAYRKRVREAIARVRIRFKVSLRCNRLRIHSLEAYNLYSHSAFLLALSKKLWTDRNSDQGGMHTEEEG